jgi:hypothetical protein
MVTIKYISELTSTIDVKVVSAPKSGRSVTGYGSKIPTNFMVRGRVGDQWRRVYNTCYSNCQSTWIKVCGETYHFHDTDFLDFNPAKHNEIQRISILAF